MPSQSFKLDGNAAKYLHGRKSMQFIAEQPANGVQIGCPVICASPALIVNGCKGTYTPNQSKIYTSRFTADPLILDIDYSTPGAVPFWTTTSFASETDSYDPWAGSQKYLESATGFPPSQLFFEFRGPYDSGVTCRLQERTAFSTAETPDTWSFADTDAGSPILSWNASEYWSTLTTTSFTGSGGSGEPRRHVVAYSFNHFATFTPVFSGGPYFQPSNRFTARIVYTYTEDYETAAYWRSTERHDSIMTNTSSSLVLTHHNGSILRNSWTMVNDGTVPGSINVVRS